MVLLRKRNYPLHLNTLVMTNMKEQKTHKRRRERYALVYVYIELIHKALSFADRSATARVPVRSLLNNITGRHGSRIHISQVMANRGDI